MSKASEFEECGNCHNLFPPAAMHTIEEPDGACWRECPDCEKAVIQEGQEDQRRMSAPVDAAWADLQKNLDSLNERVAAALEAVRKLRESRDMLLKELRIAADTLCDAYCDAPDGRNDVIHRPACNRTRALIKQTEAP